MKTVVKRDGTREEFDGSKIQLAIWKAMSSIEETELNEDVSNLLSYRVEDAVYDEFDEDEVHVDDVHKIVENTLMERKMFDTAREYIGYRKDHGPDIFRKRVNYKPFEYPWLSKYKDAIRHSYWLHTEFSYSSDIQDMEVNMTHAEVEAVKRSMLSISQIEVAVKKFWGRIDDHLPKPEISDIGATFSDSESRHSDAYGNLIEIMGLNKEFKNMVDGVPAMKGRIEYLTRANRNNNSDDPKEYFEAIILFSMFIENISLFSQFYIIMSFNKFKNLLKGMSNVIESTSKEELIHAEFGGEVVRIIRDENPSWWTDDLKERIVELSWSAYEAELGVLDWIYEEGDIESAPKETVIEFIRDRFNRSMEMLNMPYMFAIDDDAVETFEWYNVEQTSTKLPDFFNKRNVAYNKRSKSVTEDDLF